MTAKGGVNLQKKDERVEDLHLALSEKYMAYKDLSDRCMINTQNTNKGDKRVFYMRPENIFLEEPKIQNEYRHEFVKMVSQPPMPEPQTLFADDLHKFMLEHIQDKSNPDMTRQELCTFFKRRQYKLQHKKYKLLQRWSHYALTSELVDKVSLKFSPNYSKIQFELENSVKRYQRLEGQDHFLDINRPQPKQAGMIFKEDKMFAASCLRIDDLDVYMRVSTYEEKINKTAETFIHNVKWLPLSQRFEIFRDSVQYFQSLRKESISNQEQRLEKLLQKGQEIIESRKLDSTADKELQQILSVQYINKQKKKNHNVRDEILNTCKYNYEVPQMIAWNEVEMKVQLQERMHYFGVQGDLEIDFGHSFAYNIMVFFPTYFQTQVVKSQFAIYDALPDQIDTQELAQSNLRLTLERNHKRYGKAMGKNIVKDFMQKQSEESITQTQFINSIEKALFGEFNRGQIKDFPQVRIKKSEWIIYQCYKPQLSNDQLFQASILGSENNNIDECLAHCLELLNVNDVQHVNLVLDSLSSMHHDKLKFGQIRTDFLLKYGAFLFPKEFQRKDYIEEEIYTEQDKNFLSVFMGCLRVKSEFEANKDIQDISASSLLNVPQHLLFALYILKYLKARESKIKLLYTLNAFRAIQKRLTLELREMGTRDRVMGDVIVIDPLEDKKKNLELQTQGSVRTKGGQTSKSVMQKLEERSAYSRTFASKEEDIEEEEAEQEYDSIDIINIQVVDLMKIKFKEKFKNLIFSTCPILPRFHQTFGEPIERQEISSEIENSKVADQKKEEGKKLLGRVDEVSFNAKTQTYFVKDDFGKHILYESTLLDMKSLEQEIIKICSFYIGKQEPCLDQDLKNIYPSVCRFGILEQIFDLELQYQNAKVELALCYMECFDHICDLLEQSRMVQVIVDLMAERPKLNLSSTHFRDSYLAEIERLDLNKKIIREVMRMQIKKEFRENNNIREYLERTYMVVMDQGDGKWNYTKPENVEEELKNREVFQKGVQEETNQKKEITRQNTINLAKEEGTGRETEEEEKKKDGQIFNSKFSDPKEFASYLGIPFASLQMLMQDYKERDPMVKQSIHEHVSFIKIEEGYPIFIYGMANKLNNTFQMSKESERIGILDFYESLQIITKIAAVVKICNKELSDVHRPDNGLLSTCLEISTLKYILAELKLVKEGKKLIEVENSINYIQDDSIVGNPERMLFYAKEFSASQNDEMSSHNPYVLSKLNLNTIRNFPFEDFQKIIAENKEYSSSLGNSEFREFNLRRKLTTHHVYRYFPKLKQRAQKIFIPSMLKLTCNSVELLRLRSTLVNIVNQKFILEKVYEAQIKMMAKEGKIYFKDPMNFQTFVNIGENINFIDEGPASGINVKLAINEFDPTLRSHLNFSDPEAFKAMICPLGLEELRVVVLYELMNLQALVVGTKHNQMLIDTQMRALSELEFFLDGYSVANPIFDVYQKMSGTNLIDTSQYALKKIYQQEKSMVSSVIVNHPASLCYNVISRKNRIKPNIEKTFQKIRAQVADESKQEKKEILLRELRTLRAVMCQDYCFEVLSEVYSDAIKLQLMTQVDQLRRRQYLLPKEHQFLIMPNPKYGEYYSVYNNRLEDSMLEARSFTFEHKINNMFQIPLYNEIVDLEPPLQEIKEVNLPNLYQYELFETENKTPHLTKNSQEQMLKRRLPKLEVYKPSELELVINEKKRLVDFKNSMSFESTQIFQYLSYFKTLSNLFDLEFFQNKIGSSAYSIASIESYVLSGLPFWEESQDSILEGLSDYSSDEDKPPALKKNSQFSVTDIGQKNKLTKAVVVKMAEEKRQKLRLLQELESIKDKFTELDKIMEKLELNSSLEKAAEFLNFQVDISFYGMLQSLGRIQDNYYQEGIGKKEIQFINTAIAKLSHQDDVKLTYTNGFHVNSAVTALEKINIEENIYHCDYFNFFLAAQPIIDERALNPQALTLIEGIFVQDNVNKKTHKKNPVHIGQIVERDFEFLDYTLVNISKDIRRYFQSNFQSVDNSLKEYIKAKHKVEESTFFSNQQLYFDILNDKRNYLRSLIKSRQLKRIYMMIMSENTIPSDQSEYKKLAQQYHDEINWKISHQLDIIQQSRVQAPKPKDEQGSIVQSMKKKANAISTVLQAYEKAQVEIEVLSNEVQKFLLNTSFRLLQQETTALAKAFELNGRLDFYIHPCQQFASTPNMSVDKRHHLDPINKVSSAQKFLTQVKNRSLEVETITSGTGILISLKDLKDCLHELCRGVIKHGEIEMRTRCETFALEMVQFENLLHIKDQQLWNLETKLQHAKHELDKIISTKVFAKGNQMIFELDFTTRQLRLMKDNVFTLEKKLQEKVRLTYDKDLEQARVKIEEYRKKFLDYSENVNARVIADVRENCNNIDAQMKAKADEYKDLSKQTSVNNQTIINIKNFNFSDNNQMGADALRIVKDYDKLKMHEKEARLEIVKLQTVIRKQRQWYRMKEVLVKQKHDFKIDNLKSQLTSNACLWEQLGESERRENILKQELIKSQQEIATQEKIIERLKDELKKERAENEKLEQYKSTKAKRLEELENKAREFEVMSSISLPKLLSLLEQKEGQLVDLKTKERIFDTQMSQFQRIKEQELSAIKRKATIEQSVKDEALMKLENMKQEMRVLEGQDRGAVEVWKDKCKQLIEICKSFKEENEKLNLHVNLLQADQVSNLNSERKLQNHGELNELFQQSKKSQVHQVRSINQIIEKEDNKIDQRVKRYSSQQPPSSTSSNKKDIFKPKQSDGSISSRTKIKKDQIQQQLRKAQQQQQDLLYKSIDQVMVNEHMNHSSILGPASKFQPGGMNIQERTSEGISLPKITRTTNQLSQLRGNNQTDFQIVNRKPGQNIFTSKDDETPKKQTMYRNEGESQRSSNAGQMTPMYEVGVDNFQQMRYHQYQSHSKKLEESKQAQENVFSSLNKSSYQQNQRRDERTIGQATTSLGNPSSKIRQTGEMNKSSLDSHIQYINQQNQSRNPTFQNTQTEIGIAPVRGQQLAISHQPVVISLPNSHKKQPVQDTSASKYKNVQVSPPNLHLNKDIQNIELKTSMSQQDKDSKRE